jgi:hypothetical protein
MKKKNQVIPIYLGAFFLLTGLVLVGINKFGRSAQIEDFTEVNATLLNSPRLSETGSRHDLKQRIYLTTQEYINVSFLINDKTYHLGNAKTTVKLKPNDKIFLIVQLDDLEIVRNNSTNKTIIELYGLRTENEVFYTLKDKIEFDKERTRNTRLLSLIGGLGLIIYGLYKKKQE